MRKRVLSFALALCLLLALMPQTSLTALASKSDTDVAYAVEGGNIYFDKATGTITDCDHSVTSVNIPAQIEGVAVTSIGKNAFTSCQELVNVIIPEGVTSIGYAAFWECLELVSVTIPDSVTILEYGAFGYCFKLTGVTIPSGVTSIGSYAFYACSSLTSVVIPDSVTTLGYGAFSCCEGLTSVTIGNGVTSIEGFAFEECRSLTSVVIPCNITSISAWAFSGCENLTSVFFCGDAPTLGEGVFTGYIDGKDVNIPGLTLYYIDGKEGWTSPAWNGYPTATWGGKLFSDVKTESWFYSYVLQASAQGLVNGYEDNTFRPFGSLTRAEATTLLYRAGGSPAVTGKATFTDLDGQWYQDAICWAQQNKVVNGISATEFAPNTPISREAFLTMIWRAAGSPAAEGSLSDFADTAELDTWAVTAFAWAVEKGIINGTTLPGKTGLHLAPLNNITRAEAAKILVVYTGL